MEEDQKDMTTKSARDSELDPLASEDIIEMIGTISLTCE